VLASSTTWSHLHARSPCVFHEFKIAGESPPEPPNFATTPLEWRELYCRLFLSRVAVNRALLGLTWVCLISTDEDEAKVAIFHVG
jgi:hypothetical protein